MTVPGLDDQADQQRCELLRQLRLSRYYVAPHDAKAVDARLARAQARAWGEQGTYSPISAFSWPAELLWARRGEVARRQGLSENLLEALIRIYDGMSYLWVHRERLYRATLVEERGQWQVRHAQVSRAAMHADLGAAVLAASTVRERCFDAAARLAKGYLGEELSGQWRRSNRVQPEKASEDVLAHFLTAWDASLAPPGFDGVACAAVQGAVRNLLEPSVEFVAGSRSVTVTADDLSELRHTIAHGKNGRPDLLTPHALDVLEQVLEADFTSLCWLLLGTTHGRACPEYQPLLGGAVPGRQGTLGDR